MSASARRIFVTSALPYASGQIHIGHLLEHIQTDIWVRFQRLRGHTCVYACADDSHGTPMMLAAERLGQQPEELVEVFRAAHAADLANFHVAHDIFYTTHSDENRHLSALIYERIRDAGYVVTKCITQFFDPHRGMFLADRFVQGTCPRCGADDQYGDNCEICGATYDATELGQPRSTLSGATPELRQSEHFFFDISRLHDSLEAWIASGPLQPEVANKIHEWLAAGLQPWDISRDAPYFGFPIPDTKGKFLYVWVDAPVGYMAALKHLADQREHLTFNEFWEPGADTEVHHFIGKDIINFHCVFWPAMLKASDFRLPTRIHTHGFLTVDGTKMSKSRGTFINASTYLEHLDPEYLRYYFAAKLRGNTDDIDLSLNDFVTRVNADLIGKVVNIASRCAGFVHRGAAGMLASDCADPALWREALAAGDHIAELYEHNETGKAVRKITALADQTNQWIDAAKPWVLAKENNKADEVQAICTLGLNLFRVLMVYLKPILPRMAADTETFLACDPLTWNNRSDWLGAHRIEQFKTLKTRMEHKDVELMLKASRDQAAPAAAPMAVPTDTGIAVINIDKFAQLDLRVAEVLNAEPVDGSEKLLRLTLNAGPLGKRTVFAGIRAAYEPAAIQGRRVILLANLAPREMWCGISEGMILAAGSGGQDIFLLSPDDGAKPGMAVR